jgi:hypothetical protein
VGENESLIVLRETTKYRGELKLTVVLHRLVGLDLPIYEIHPPMKEENMDIQRRRSVGLLDINQQYKKFEPIHAYRQRARLSQLAGA